jgi:hypothetical protein
LPQSSMGVENGCCFSLGPFISDYNELEEQSSAWFRLNSLF